MSKSAKKTCTISGCLQLPEDIHCCINTDICSHSTSSSRWHHFSDCEHYCNYCFEYYYRPKYDGYSQYNRWRKANVELGGRRVLSLKSFFADQILPFWLQCIECNRWRLAGDYEIMDDSIVRRFTCKDVSLVCEDDVEDRSVSDYRDARIPDEFVIQLKHAPYHYFCQHLPADQVNMSFFNNHLVGVYKNIPDCVKPFESSLHGSFDLYNMTDEESLAFPSFKKNTNIYLSIRNSIIALWFLNPTKYITLKDLMYHIIIRGMIRIKLEVVASYVLNYLTNRGYVNFGFTFGREIPTEINDTINQTPIIVIGAGIAGLSAACHLKNMGYKVKVLEASGSPGGRIKDAKSKVDGKVVALGGEFIDGHTNNPLSILIEQLYLETFESNREPTLYSSNGNKRFDFSDSNRYSVYVDLLLESGCDIDIPDDDRDILSMMKEHMKEHNGTELSEEELFFMIHNIENVFGTSCSNISSRVFGYLESLPFYSGKRICIKQGISSIINALSENVQVEYFKKVTKVKQGPQGVEVYTDSGDLYPCSRCVCSAPVHTLRSIAFLPPLPKPKLEAVDAMGRGLQEKLVLRFQECFWSHCMDAKMCLGICKGLDLQVLDDEATTDNGGGGGGDSGGSVNQCRDFAVFYDITNKGDTLHTLTTTVSKPRRDNLSRCLAVLSTIVGRPSPLPVETFASDWTSDCYRGDVDCGAPSTHCYPLTGAHCHLVEELEAPFQRVYFAGDGYNSDQMATMHSAYLSGINTASKLVEEE